MSGPRVISHTPESTDVPTDRPEVDPREGRSDPEKSPEEEPSEDSNELTVTTTDEDNWNVVVALGLAGVGFLIGSPVLLAAATIPLLYAATANLTGAPPATVTVTRELTFGDGSSETDEILSGEPGRKVQVRLTVHNESDLPLVDLRLVDGVPNALPVVEGSPRACLALDPGETETVEYAIELQRGEHTFESLSLRGRDIAGTSTVDWGQDALGDQKLNCSPAVKQAPIGSGSNEYAGDVPTDEGGSGIEFHSVREYEPGDPVQSIDWRRYANSRELASIEYRAERSARILCVVDTRRNQFQSPADSELSVVELTADAMERTIRRLLDEGHPTGVATIDKGGVNLIPPGTGPEHRERVSALMGNITEEQQTSFGSRPRKKILLSDATVSGPKSRRISEDPELALQQSTSNTTTVFLFSGFLDDDPVELVTHLSSLGYSVTVVSPAVAGEDTARTADGIDLENLSTRLVGLERRNRLTEARNAGASVLEWDLDESVGTVLDRAVREVNGL